MTQKIEDYILVQNLLPESFCDEVVAELQSCQWERASWYNYAENVQHSKREQEPEMLRASRPQQEKINPYVIQALEKYQNACGWSGLDADAKSTQRWITRVSLIRFNRYPVGTRMRQHYDHIQSIFDGSNKGIPIVSVVGNLNDGYEGSKFYCRDAEISLRKGDLLIFPSNFMFPHEVTPTTNGVRYSFVTWAF